MTYSIMHQESAADRQWLESLAYPDEWDATVAFARRFLAPSIVQPVSDVIALLEPILDLTEATESILGRKHAATRLAYKATGHGGFTFEFWRAMRALRRAQQDAVLAALRRTYEENGW